MQYLESNFGPAAQPGPAMPAGASAAAMPLAAACEHAPAMLSRYAHWKIQRTIAVGADEKLTLAQLDEMVARGPAGVRSCQVLFAGNLEYIVHLQCVERNPVSQTVPEIIVRMCHAIREAGGFSSKGIFRIAAQREHITAARARIEAGNWTVPAAEASDPHTPADVLKVWLRELLTPVVPVALYDQALKACDSEADCLALVERELPPVHYATLDYLLTFLAELSLHERDTSMGSDNLAIVFSQDLLRTEEKDPAQLFKNSGREKNFVRQLINAWAKRGNGAQAAASQ